MDHFLIFLVLLLSCKNTDLSIRTLRLVHTVPKQSHTSFSVCSVHHVNYHVSQFEFLSMSLDIVCISTGVKFSSLAKFSASLISGFLNRINWLKSVSPIVSFWASRISLLSPFLNTLSLTSK